MVRHKKILNGGISSSIGTKPALKDHCLAEYEKNLLRDLVCGCISSDEAAEHLKDLKCTGFLKSALSAQTELQVLLIRYKIDAPNQDTRWYSECSVIKRNLNNIYTYAFRQFRFFCLLDITFDTQVIVADSASGDIIDIFKNIFLKTQVYKNPEYCVFVGNPVRSLFDVFISYRSALCLLETFSSEPACTIVSSDTVAKKTLKNEVYYPLDSEQKLIHAVIHKKVELWQSILTDIIIENKKNGVFGASQLSVLLTATVRRILNIVQKKAEDVFKKNTDVFLQLALCRTYEKLYENMKFVFMYISDSLRDEESKTSPLVQRMENFIRKNYGKNIGLYDVAEAVNLSPNYVSAVFKNTLGKNFKDYLNNCRYEAACKLIRTAPLKKIKQVAAECGCNSDILTRIFFKYGGMLPSDFQKNVLQTQVSFHA